jgi:hypothetical protein
VENREAIPNQPKWIEKMRDLRSPSMTRDNSCH